MSEDDRLDPRDLDLDLSEEELIRAEVPLELDDGDNPEATHPLTEAPLPSGAGLGRRKALEPLLSSAGDAAEEDSAVERQLPRIQPPAFILRLAMESNSKGKFKEEKITDQSWLLSSGDSWPVFIHRFRPGAPAKASVLKKFALAAVSLGENRVCLSAEGCLDVFFNDRKSLEEFTAELDSCILPQPAGDKVRILTCPGLLTCPMAAVDTLSTGQKLAEILAGHAWIQHSRFRPQLTLSVAGCQAGQGLGCGLNEYSDIRLTGRRETYPVIDQKIAALSTDISALITGCPGQAINRSHQTGVTAAINRDLCRRCGWCVYRDPAFSWPAPQGGFFSMEAAGRREKARPEYVKPMTLWPKLPDNWIEVGSKLIKLIELWLVEGLESEIFADFAVRLGIT